MMRKFAHAAVLAVAISAPVLAGGLMDHSVVSVLGAPGIGGCSSGCGVGGATNPATGQPGNGAVNSGGAAQGGHTAGTNPFTGAPQTQSGTLEVTGVGSGTGRQAVGGSNPGTASGNFTGGIPTSKGHCTGQFQVGGVCG